MPSSSLGGTVIEIRVPRRMWDPESEWEGWGTVVPFHGTRRRVWWGRDLLLLLRSALQICQWYVTSLFFFLFFFFCLGRGGGSDLSLSLILGWQYQWNTLITHTPLLLFYTFSHIHLCPFHPLLYLLNLSSSFWCFFVLFLLRFRGCLVTDTELLS